VRNSRGRVDAWIYIRGCKLMQWRR
jgi:hypothetical protein